MTGGPGSWADLIAVNPRNRDRLLAIGSEEFERVMYRWLNAYIPKPNESIPGVSDWEFEGIKVPTLIIRGGAKDYDHPPRTSMEVHSLISRSRLIDPPWPEDAWERASEATAAGTVSLRSLGARSARPAGVHRRVLTEAELCSWPERTGAVFAVALGRLGVSRVVPSRVESDQESASRAGKPPLLMGLHLSTVIRMSTFPWSIMAWQYSSQSGCSPLMERK
jgi:hypothetical protein